MSQTDLLQPPGQATLKDAILSRIGLPFIERELGTRAAQRVWLMVGAMFSALLVGVNVFYLLNLMDIQRESPWMLSADDTTFLIGGMASVVGTLALQLAMILATALMAIAPALGCLTVIKESESRTLESLQISPLGGLQLHNGFVFGALAKLAPTLVAPLALYLCLPLTGEIAVWTTLETATLLLVGGWAMTSVGVVLGTLMRRFAKGPLFGLLVFSMIVGYLTLPLFALGERDLLPTMLASPVAAIVHSLLLDSNIWLVNLFQWDVYFGQELQVFYSGSFLGLPIIVGLMSLLIAIGLGVLSTRASARKLSDEHAPALSFTEAALSLGALSSLGTMMVTRLVWDRNMRYLENVNYYMESSVGYGTDLARCSAVIALLTLPCLFLIVMATVPPRSYMERAAIWSVTRPASALGMTAHHNMSRRLVLLALIPVLFVMGHGLVSFDFTGRATATFGHRWLAWLPLMWTLLVSMQVIRLWQTSARKAWQSVGAFVAVTAAYITGAIYGVVIIDENSLNIGDFDLGIRGALGTLMGMFLILGLLALPAILAAWLKNREQSFTVETAARLAHCALGPDTTPTSPEWPAARQPRRLSLLLRPALHTRSPEGSVFERPVQVDRWLVLDTEGQLELWTGEPGQEGSKRVVIDLTRPFSINGALQPSEKVMSGRGLHNPEVLTALNMSITQNTDAPGDFTTIGVAIPARRVEFTSRLPFQDQRLPLLSPRDTEALLGALRYHADAVGVALPW